MWRKCWGRGLMVVERNRGGEKVDERAYILVCCARLAGLAAQPKKKCIRNNALSGFGIGLGVDRVHAALLSHRRGGNGRSGFCLLGSLGRCSAADGHSLLTRRRSVRAGAHLFWWVGLAWASLLPTWPRS